MSLLAQYDPDIAQAIAGEVERESNTLEMIASEISELSKGLVGNMVSISVNRNSPPHSAFQCLWT